MKQPLSIYIAGLLFLIVIAYAWSIDKIGFHSHAGNIARRLQE